MVSPTRLTIAVTGLLGVWLVAAPFVLGAPLVDQWNDVAVGGVIAILAGCNHSHDRIHGTPSRGISGAHVVLGGWLLFAPFVSGVTGALLWNDVGVGVLVSAFAGYNAYASSLGVQTVDRAAAGDP